MARKGTFEYDVVARGRTADAWPLMTEYSKHASLHPFIIDVKHLPTAPGALRSYRITDRLRWGPFRFRVSYLTDVVEVKDQRIVTVARQWPRTTVINVTELAEEGESVRAHVVITVSAPMPLFGYTLKQAKIAHEGLAARLVTVIEESSERADRADTAELARNALASYVPPTVDVVPDAGTDVIETRRGRRAATPV